jgi:hypothetical protein
MAGAAWAEAVPDASRASLPPDALTLLRRTLALVELSLLAETLNNREDYLRIAFICGRANWRRRWPDGAPHLD